MLLLLCAMIAPLQVRIPVTEARQYEKVEIEVDAGGFQCNPFDPDEVTLDAEVTMPSGAKLRVPGFWYQDYRRTLRNPDAKGVEREEVLALNGKPGWRLRFASGETGEHRILLQLKDLDGVRRSGPYSVQVRAGARPGFVRVSPRNCHYLEYSSGLSFFPIGENLCMYQRREGTYYFDRLLERLAANGGNYVRLWQEYYVPRDPTVVAKPGDAEFTGFPLETQSTGLGRYDLASAWRLDHVAETCERLDIYWQLAFEMTVWWQTKMTHRWSRNPYNAANGGPCRKPQDYFTNPAARELVRRRLRYSVARWGWAMHLAAWELWNEVDNNEGFDSVQNANWHREMGAYLQSIDPWRHLVTTSWRDPRMFALPEIDIVQAHSYWDARFDAAEYAQLETDHLMRPFQKPFFFGEQGVEDPELARRIDPQGRHFHDALWSSVMSGAAGTGLYWWWHNYVEPLDLYRHFKPLAGFLAGVDWPSRQWARVGLSRPNIPVGLRVYGLTGGDRALVWLHDPLAFQVDGGKVITGPDQTGASANIVGLEDGEYRIEWWDTEAGKPVRTDVGSVRHSSHFGYGLELEPPAFRADIAARIERH